MTQTPRPWPDVARYMTGDWCTIPDEVASDSGFMHHLHSAAEAMGGTVDMYYDKLFKIYHFRTTGAVRAYAPPTINCVNCGAPYQHPRCAYCGTTH